MRPIERRKCPPEFQARLTRVGGMNRYGQPNFIIVWGQSWSVRRGGTWDQDDGHYFRGYRDVLEDGRPCWVLKQWKAPECYGTPRMYFLENMEPETGLQILGDYPWKGQYETVQPFVCKEIINSRLVLSHMPLNSMMLDLVVPIIIRCKQATYTQKKAALDALKEKEDKDLYRKVEAKRHDSKMAFRGPVSFARQVCHTSLVDKKVNEINRHFDKAMLRAKSMSMGISVH